MEKISRNSHINGDCLEVMSQIEDASVDLIFSDLPYGETNNKLDIIIPFDQLWAHYNRILKPTGSVLLWAQGKFQLALGNSNIANFKYDIVWSKVLTSGFLNAKRMPLRKHESILLFNRKPGTYNPQFTQGQPLHSKGISFKEKEIVNQNYGKFNHTDDLRKGSTEKYPTTILPFDIDEPLETFIEFQKPHPSKAKHRTEKPVSVLEWGIKTYSNEGDLVLDNCSGCGNMAIACMNTNRDYILIEKDLKTYLEAQQNIITNGKPENTI